MKALAAAARPPKKAPDTSTLRDAVSSLFEGDEVPDVFKPPKPDKASKAVEEEKKTKELGPNLKATKQVFKDEQEAETIDLDEGKELSNLANDIFNDTKPKKPKDLATKMKEMLEKAVESAEKEKDKD